MSTVEEIMSQIASESNNTSRAVSIVNDETQRGWNLSATEIDQLSSADESIILEVCEYFDGQQERVCGGPVEPGKSRCPEHERPEFDQPMQMIKQMKKIEPGRAFTLVKGLMVEVPKPKSNPQSKYANSMNGDTKAYHHSLTNLRKLLRIAYEVYPGQGVNDEFHNFDARPFMTAFEEVQYSETRWYAIYQSLKETLMHKSLDLNLPWVDYAFVLANKTGRIQGYIDIDREVEQLMAREDGTTYWNEPYSKTILDNQIFRPEVREKVPGLYLTRNRNCILPYLNNQTDGEHSQTGKYEKGYYQSPFSQPIMGIFHDQRALQYENPDDDTAVSMKALVKIQVEQDFYPTKNKERGKFHEKLCLTSTDKVDKYKVQMMSITRKVK